MIEFIVAVVVATVTAIAVILEITRRIEKVHPRDGLGELPIETRKERESWDESSSR